MSASFATAALGRSFTLDPASGELELVPAPAAASRHAALADHLRASPKLACVTAASRLELRPVPELVLTGVADFDALTGGLPRGCLTEICGPASSGRTSLLLAALSAATRRQEVCALVDAGDSLDPQGAAASGVDWNKLLWVRCASTSRRAAGKTASDPWEQRMEQVLKTTDLLLQSNGFGLIAIDLSDIPLNSARRIPLTSWFRFRRAVEHTPTVLLVVEQQPIAGSCSSLLVNLAASGKLPDLQQAPVCPSHARLLQVLHATVEVQRSRLERKPSQSTRMEFYSRPAWAG